MSCFEQIMLRKDIRIREEPDWVVVDARAVPLDDVLRIARYLGCVKE